MNIERVFGVAAIALVAAALVAAFLFLGTPGDARLFALDEKRVEDLQSIAVNLHDTYGDRLGATLPASLPEGFTRDDPATHRVYRFQRINAKEYILCATFARPTRVEDENQTGTTFADRVSWRHTSGRTCFRLNVDSNRVDPQVVRS